MNDVAIKVENLGKKYVINHQKDNGDDNLREVVVGSTKKIIGALNPFKKRVKQEKATEDFWALNDVNFEVNQGDKIGIIGRNGAGKSTLLKVLSRITEPTTGKIHINGRVASLLEVGTGFHPELTGRENIYLNGAILGMSRKEIRTKFDEIVDFSEVEKFLDTPVKRYSSGMYVRLAFAVAAHLEPEILIVDEVLAVGDAEFQKKCLGKMEDVSSEGRTVLFVSHNLDAITTLCNRGIVLDRGCIIFNGLSIEARKQYLKISKEKSISIQNNAGRSGSGEAVITCIEVLSDFSGENNKHTALTINLKANISESLRQRKDIQVAFGIDTENGIRLFTFVSGIAGFEVVVTPNINIRWFVNDLPFITGRYLVSATIIFKGETLDCVQHCASFDIPVKNRETHVERLSCWGYLDLKSQLYNLK